MSDDASTSTEQQDNRLETDGGHDTVDYLDEKIHMFKPATPFMKDHLKVIWGLFAVWILFTFGPVTATWVATDFMTSTQVLGFQLHYFLTAIGSPVGALILCAAYAWQRDRLDAQYGVDHGTKTEAEAEAGTAVATDGGEQS